jgi:HEAT repeat protein
VIRRISESEARASQVAAGFAVREEAAMRWAAPVVPKDWQLTRLEDGSAQATITRKPAGWAVAALGLLLSLWLSLVILGPGMWLMALALLVVFLVHLADQLVHGVFGTEVWHFSGTRLNVRKRVLGISWWDVDYTRGALSVVSDEGVNWDLRFQSAAKLYSLFSSNKLDDVLGLAAFLEEELGWPLRVTEPVPPFFRQLVTQVLTANDRGRMQFLLQDERLVVVLVRAGRELATLQRSRLREMLRSLEEETACLSRLVEGAEPATRASAAELLGELGEAGALPVLRNALQDASGQVRVRAAEALGRMRDQDAVGALCALLQYAPELRIAAVRALGLIGDAGAIPALAELLTGSGRAMDAECRWAVVAALGQIKAAAAVYVLAAVLHDAVPDIREAAAEACGEIGSGEAVPSLLPVLRDPVERVALRAAFSLGRIRHPSALSDLIRTLSDPRLQLRAGVTRAVAAIGGVPAIQALCGALNDPASPVRYEAAAGLSRVVSHGPGGPIELRAALPQLRRLSSPLSTESAEVKHACRDAIRRIERDTEMIKQLPVPAEGVTSPSTLLPLPADAVACEVAIVSPAGQL